MKVLKNMVVVGWLALIALEVVLHYAGQGQEYPIIRQDRMATIPIMFFLTAYYIFRRYDQTKES